jgi:hypothetical protein
MSELRKPTQIWLLRDQGKRKTKKIEIFNSRQWEDGGHSKSQKWRLRVNGKWFSNKKTGQKYFGSTEFKDMFWRSIHL